MPYSFDADRFSYCGSIHHKPQRVQRKTGGGAVSFVQSAESSSVFNCFEHLERLLGHLADLDDVAACEARVKRVLQSLAPL